MQKLSRLFILKRIVMKTRNLGQVRVLFIMIIVIVIWRFPCLKLQLPATKLQSTRWTTRVSTSRTSVSTTYRVEQIACFSVSYWKFSLRIPLLLESSFPALFRGIDGKFNFYGWPKDVGQNCSCPRNVSRYSSWWFPPLVCLVTSLSQK